MGCPSCLSGPFTAMQELVGRDRKDGVEEEDLWGKGEVVKGEFEGDVAK